MESFPLCEKLGNRGGALRRNGASNLRICTGLAGRLVEIQVNFAV